MKKLIICSLLLSATAATHAIENVKTICSHGNETRVIEVVYKTENAVPCEVRYAKSNSSKVLWSANNAENYCEEKANAFIEKQKGWGWSCEVAANEMSTMASSEAEMQNTEETSADMQAEPAAQ
jgi:hypothetical protein